MLCLEVLMQFLFPAYGHKPFIIGFTFSGCSATLGFMHVCIHV